MTTRTSHTSVTFMRPFSLSGIEGVQAAGTYTVETHEDLLQGLSFSAYRRTATLMFLPLRTGGAFLEQVVEVDPAELEAARGRDAAEVQRLAEEPPEALP
jgi:hypothetical protein